MKEPPDPKRRTVYLCILLCLIDFLESAVSGRHLEATLPLVAQHLGDTPLLIGHAVELIRHAVEQSDNMQWQVDIEAMQAHALWAIGDLEGAVATASQCLRGSEQIESAIGPGRLNALYIQMVLAGQAKQTKVREFGEMLLSS